MIRIITALALRLFAIYVLALAALGLPALLLSVAQAFDPAESLRAHWLLLIILLSLLLLLALLLFTLLWRLGNAALRNAEALATPDMSAMAGMQPIDFQRWQVLLFSLLGLYFCGRGLADGGSSMLAWLIQSPLPLPNVGAVDMSRLLAFEHAMAALRALIELLIGLGILIGAVCKTAPAH
ncbi:hypothetical protein [Metallibacterium scheffleri]|uniref:hypothetical protein n=2 Tax=Metallibacterium scheffleri TaxID=993689 RepID=UPI0023F39291|nr:hypothetical protein [Metallibacterium scheffleri]